MADQNRINSKGYGTDSVAVDDSEGDFEKECTRFCIESEETMDDTERERWRRDAKKYEDLIDRLFDGSEDQPSDPN